MNTASAAAIDERSIKTLLEGRSDIRVLSIGPITFAGIGLVPIYTDASNLDIDLAVVINFSPMESLITVHHADTKSVGTVPQGVHGYFPNLKGCQLQAEKAGAKAYYVLLKLTGAQ